MNKNLIATLSVVFITLNFYASISIDAERGFDANFNCNLNMPEVYSMQGCAVIDEPPNSASGEVEFMWAQNINGNIYALTEWSTQTLLSYCPEEPSLIRLCARVVGCFDVVESDDIWIEDCVNITDGGSIGDDEIICLGQAAFITNMESPSGGNGEIDYLWLTNSLPVQEGADTLFSNTEDLLASPYQNTYYQRLSKTYNCTDYTGVSNWVLVEVIQDCCEDFQASVTAVGELCQGPVTLSAHVVGANECDSCCYRFIANTNPDNSCRMRDYVLYMADTVRLRGAYFKGYELTWEECNGVAHITGIAHQAHHGITYYMDIYFSDAISEYPQDSLKRNFCDSTIVQNDWTFYENISGTLYNVQSGLTVNVSRRGLPYQVGWGANRLSEGYGGNGWIFVDTGLYHVGDINPMLSAECYSDTTGLGSTTYVWSTGDTTQTIEATEPGIYTVIVSDCVGCQDTAVYYVAPCTANVGDYVWNDLNGNGIQEALEPGIPEMIITLFGPGPDSLFHTSDDVIIAIDTTDVNGNYLIEDVESGFYCIEFNQENTSGNLIFTNGLEGDTALDSNADEHGKTEIFEVVGGTEDNLSIDCGLIECPEILASEPMNLILSCDEDIPEPIDPVFTVVVGLYSVEFSESINYLGCNIEILRTWIATNECGNISSVSQVITVIDSSPPLLEGIPLDKTEECFDLPEIPAVTAIDNCDPEVEISFYEDVEFGDCSISVIRTWIALDDCGNETSQSQTLIFEDTTAPILLAPDDITLSCIEDIQDLENTGQAVATDNCEGAVIISYSDSSFVNDCTKVINRYWMATDTCGNVASALQVISVVDEEPPSVLNSPEDTTISCTDPWPVDEPLFEDLCDDSLDIILEEIVSPNGCNYIILRTWIAIDDCGLSTSVQQSITVIDDTAPYFTEVPEDKTVHCDAIPEIGETFAEDNCNTASIFFIGETISDGCPYTIVRSWIASDECGNEAFASQTITVTDTVSPVITFNPQVEVDCELIDSYLVPVTENCGVANLSFTDEVFSGACLGVIERTWTAEDACGNLSTAFQFITPIDTIAPLFETLPVDTIVACSDDIPSAIILNATDNCDEDVEVIFSETQSGTDCPYMITRTWTAIDDCENDVFAEQVITVVTEVELEEPSLLVSPNPFNNHIKLTFASPQEGRVIIELYNSQGQLLDVVINQEIECCMEYERTIYTNQLNGHSFLAKMIAGNTSKTVKIIRSN